MRRGSAEQLDNVSALGATLKPGPFDPWERDALPSARPVPLPGGFQIMQRHDSAKLGALRSDESEAGRLLSLVDLVRWLVVVQALPEETAASRVLDRIEQGKGTVLFLTVPDRFAQPIGPDTEVLSAWYHADLAEPVRGPDAALALLRSTWLRPSSPDRLRVADRLGSVHVARFAIREADAVALFGETPIAAPVTAAAPPAHALWPLPRHVAGEAWTPAELAALQAMRDAGMSDEEIASISGAGKRQNVGNLIGSRKPRATGPKVMGGVVGHLGGTRRTS